MDKAVEEVLQQDWARIAFAPAAVKGYPINWVAHVTNSNVLSAELQ